MTKLATISREALTDAMATLIVSDDPVAAKVVADAVFEHAEHRIKNDVPQTDRVYPNYDVMIKQLFKTMPDVPFASEMHAAAGISGEAAELIGVDGRKNLLEECGDLEFYIEAMKQRFESDFENAIQQPDERSAFINLGSVITNIVTTAGDVLDIAKKSWVYGKPFDRATMTRLLMVLEINLDFVYELHGTDRDSIQRINQIKLIGPGGRFESGFYSDAAAIARADKEAVPGADRNFIGKQA